MAIEPVYVGMPNRDVTFDVGPHPNHDEWGTIRCGGACRDDYNRIVSDQDKSGAIIKLQKAALLSFHAAEKALGFPILVTGTWRSCAEQTQLHKENAARFADPNTTAHTRGLAIDVSQAQAAVRLDAINRALRSRQWYQARTDEPWHYSFGIKV